MSKKDINLQELSRIISVDQVDTDSITAYANDSEWKQFLIHDIPYRRILSPPKVKGLEMTDNDLREIGWTKYPTYSAYISLMKAFEQEYPHLCRLDTLGYSVRGKVLLAARITGTQKKDTEKPSFFYTAQIHGDEIATSIIMLRLIDTLLTAYSDSTEIWDLVENTIIWINPLANPDGAYYISNSTLDGCIRYNANEVDLNRDFPLPNQGIIGKKKERQPETLAMMTFAERYPIRMSANFHAGNECVNYPWDYTEVSHPESEWFLSVSHEYADTARYYSPDTYMSNFDKGVTNGWDWYPIYGGRQDYMTFFHACKEVTIEISDTKKLPASELNKFWTYNKRSLLNFIKRVNEGIFGDFRKWNSYPVAIEILSIPDLIIPLQSKDSLFFYPLEAGSYDICLQFAEHSDTLWHLEVNPYELTPLVPSLTHAYQTMNKPNKFTLHPPYPNPFNAATMIVLQTPFEGVVEIKIYDICGRMVKRLYNGNLSRGFHTFFWNGVNSDGKRVSSGIYIIEAQQAAVALRQKALLIQ
ncbi:MAG: M14 family zinc carboxypeptidase [Candidatus Marinimicrobia bacterium]|nr:M14 family zinc carboxypeptidase [Candidatus Neomarinimicrobiota bacterium]